jgi:nitrite reductase/ring-hydroxylating ferredoxin subunit
MPYVKAGPAAQLAPDSVIEVIIDGNPYAVCNLGGTLHAMWGVCPHQGGPLGQGEVNGKSLTCPWHAWEYNCETGENDFDPTVKVATYPVKVEGGDIFIDLP